MSLSLEDSTTYQLLVRRGETREAQATILRFGGKRFGPAPETTQAKVRGITDLEQLRQIVDRLLDATSWDDLLRTP